MGTHRKIDVVALSAILFIPFIPNQSNAAPSIDPTRCIDRPDRERLVCYDNLEKDSRLQTRPSEEKPEKPIENNFESNYITAASGLHLGADQTTQNMLYEAQIFKDFHWYDHGVGKGHYWIDVPIRIQVRQLTDDSLPVRTPSYNPGLRVFWLPRKDNPSYYSLGLHHYSNGQDGQSLLPDGRVNTSSGSFNTNYVEVAKQSTYSDGPIKFARFAFVQHFYGTWDAAQVDQYEKRHVSAELRFTEFNLFTCKQLPSQIRLTEKFGWGYGYVVKNDVDPTQNIAAETRDKLDTALELIVKPRGWVDLALYLRYDYGYDYYNINFQNRVNRVQLGVIAYSF